MAARIETREEPLDRHSNDTSKWSSRKFADSQPLSSYHPKTGILAAILDRPSWIAARPARAFPSRPDGSESGVEVRNQIGRCRLLIPHSDLDLVKIPRIRSRSVKFPLCRNLRLENRMDASSAGTRRAGDPRLPRGDARQPHPGWLEPVESRFSQKLE